MVCMSGQDNPRALTRGLSPVQLQNHTITCLLHQHVIAIYALRDMEGAITHRIGGNRKRLYNRQT